MDQAELWQIRNQIESLLIKQTSDTLGLSLGRQWRIIEGPYPTQSSQSCIQIQFRKGTEWTTVDAFRPDGTDIKSCYAIYNNGAGTFVLTNATFPLFINYTTKVVDTDNAVTVGTDWHFTCPTGKGGMYLVQASLGITIPAATGYDATMSIFYNGTTNDFLRGVRLNATTFVATSVNPLLSGMLLLNPGDTIRISGFQNSGANRTLNTEAQSNRVSIARMSFAA